MYTGRTILATKLLSGKYLFQYEVNSRSFKNRELHFGQDSVSVVPNSSAIEDYKNPYVTYNCCRYNHQLVVISNGSQTDPIYEKIVRGTKIRDALISVNSGLDYEFDNQSTPRISLAYSLEENEVFVSIVRDNYFCVKQVELTTGTLFALSTNELSEIDSRVNNIDLGGQPEDELRTISSSDFYENCEHNVLSLQVTCSASKVSVR